MKKCLTIFTKHLLLFAVTASTLFFAGCKQASTKHQTINPVIGDISFEAKYGHKPGVNTDEGTRITTHLEFVENLLRQKDISSLSPALQAKRNNLLGLLHNYLVRSIFPKNYDFTNERKPCFIDKDRNICAVGYLIEQTAGLKISDDINQKYKYDNLLAMSDPLVDNWVATSGFTKKELAMIQPTYWGLPEPVEPSNNKITAGYGISSSVISGFNLSMNVINSLQIGKHANGKFIPVAGLISGAGQVVLGSVMFPKKQLNWAGADVTNQSKKTLSLVNIGLGTSTIILSACNLLLNRKPKERAIAWNVYGFPLPNNNTGVAFSLTKKL